MNNQEKLKEEFRNKFSPVKTLGQVEIDNKSENVVKATIETIDITQEIFNWFMERCILKSEVEEMIKEVIWEIARKPVYLPPTVKRFNRVTRKFGIEISFKDI